MVGLAFRVCTNRLQCDLVGIVTMTARLCFGLFDDQLQRPMDAIGL